MSQALAPSRLDGAQCHQRRPAGGADGGDTADLQAGVGARMAQDPQALTTFDIPQPDRLVKAAAGQNSPIWAEGHR